MVICRNKVTNRLVEVYVGVFEFLTSCDLYHLEHCNIVDKSPCYLLDDEYEMAKGNRII